MAIPPLTLRWLGAAGIELRSNGSVLTLDPFVTRPPLRAYLYGRPRANARLVAAHLTECDHILITHTHYDHVMDAPEIIRQTGATAYVSPNGEGILKAHGVTADKIRIVRPGDALDLPSYHVTAYEAEHIRMPGLDSGPLRPDLRPPLRLRDYRMDICMSFLVRTAGLSILRGSTRSGPTVAADVVLVGAEGSPSQYARLLARSRRPVVIPVHWDDFFRPLSRSPRARLGPPCGEGVLPRRIDLERFREAIVRASPGAKVVVPVPLRTYDLTELVSSARKA